MSHSHSKTACNLIIIIFFLCVLIHSEFRSTTRRNHYQLYTKNYKINYLTMASSTLGLTLNWAPFPLVKEVLTEESTFAKISTKVQVGGQGNNIQWEKRTMKIRKIDHLNKELMSRMPQPQQWGEDLLKIPGTSGRSVPCRLGQRPSGQGQFGC
jgi:hypothetical protein